MSATTIDSVLGALLERSHHLLPDALPACVVEAAHDLGGRRVEIWLSDLSQETLVPWGHDAEPQDIEGTVAGRCYRTSVPVAVPDDDGVRLWCSLLDGTDRLGVLGTTVDDCDVNDVDDETVRSWSRLAELTAELIVARSAYGDIVHRTRRTQPMTLAAEMRWNMLPPRSFVCDRLSLAAVVEPTYAIAGDSYDYAVNGDIAHVAVFDAMGHGIEASRIVNLAVATYRHSRRVGGGLTETQRAIDEAILDQFGEATFVTGTLAELDLNSGLLHYVIAGHPRPLLFRQGRTIGTLDCRPTLPFGIIDPAPTIGETCLEPGDRVLLYSDGIVEARALDGEPFGVDRLADFLTRAHSADEPASETLRRLGRAVAAHRGTTEFEDDATLLLVEWTG